jgi:hypothetical protein
MLIRVITAEDKLIEYGLFSRVGYALSILSGVYDGAIVCPTGSIGNGSY